MRYLHSITYYLSQIPSSIVILIPSRLPSWILNLYGTKWALAFVCFSFIFFLATCASRSLGFWVHVKLFFVLYYTTIKLPNLASMPMMEEDAVSFSKITGVQPTEVC